MFWSTKETTMTITTIAKPSTPPTAPPTINGRLSEEGVKKISVVLGCEVKETSEMVVEETSEVVEDGVWWTRISCD